jgi:2-succinyl-5-enolpyruvyl-6-hydroxy-3-cyclohexene-1-carboxylate synthase
MGIATRHSGATTLLCGDLTFLHDIGGLTSLVSRNAPLRIVVVDNGGGGIFHFLPIASHPDAFEPCYLTPPATEVSKVCQGVGVQTETITNREALAKALASPIKDTHVIHVVVDGEDNVERHKAYFQ